MKKRWHGRRALLNSPGFSSTAAIVAEIEDTSGWEKGKDGDGKDLKSAYGAEPDYTLQIANCDRSIAFDLDFGPEGWANNVRKVEIMIDTLSKFRDGLIAERVAYTMRVRGIKPDA